MRLFSIKNQINQKSKICVVVFFVLFLLIGVLIFDDYGIAWDEIFQRQIGEVNFRYILSGDQKLLDPATKDQYYAPSFELFLYFTEKIFHLQDIRTIHLIRHFLTFLLFYISVICFYLLLRKRFQSWKVGLLGSLFLILSPRIFAHSFYNSKDLAFLSFFIISILSLTKFLEKPTWFYASLHGLISAILIDLRIMGVLVPFLTFFFIIKDLATQEKPRERTRKQTILSLVQYTIILVFFAILFFPASWHNPLYQFYLIFYIFKRNPDTVRVLYLGKVSNDIETHWHYIPVWIGISTPILYLCSFFVGLFFTIKSWLKFQFKRASAALSRYQIITDQIFLLWFFLPLGLIIYLRSNLYTGWRHMFFIYPAFLLLAINGLLSLVRTIQSKYQGKKYKIVFVLITFLVLVGLGEPFFFMLRNHPHQYVYFNRLAGKDMPTIQKKFDLDYWGLSYREGLEYILENDLREKIKVSAESIPGQFNAVILKPQERERLEYVLKREDADYYLTNFSFYPEEEIPFENEFYSVKVDGAKILAVYKLK